MQQIWQFLIVVFSNEHTYNIEIKIKTAHVFLPCITAAVCRWFPLARCVKNQAVFTWLGHKMHFVCLPFSCFVTKTKLQLVDVPF